MKKIAIFPGGGTPLYTWIRLYMTKYKEGGYNKAVEFLELNVPKQLHKQVMRTSELALTKRRGKRR
jgi:hypothetical protein